MGKRSVTVQPMAVLGAAAFAVLLAAMALMLAAGPVPAHADGGAAGGASTVSVQDDMDYSGVSGTCEWRVDSQGTLVVRPIDGVSGALGSSMPWDGTEGISAKSVRFEGRVKATSCSWMFSCFSNLETVDLGGLDTSEASSMDCMFEACSSLESVDLSPLDMSSVTGMNGMFESCRSLTTVKFPSLETSKADSMDGLFHNCTSLESVDLSSFDTSGVTYMGDMFTGCSSLESLDLSSLDTSNVTGMGSMFYGCTSLKTLDLSSFDTSAVTDMSYMFRRCSSLESLDLSSFDTSRVTSMTGMNEMFQGCDALAEVALGQKFSFSGSGGAYKCALPEGMWRPVGGAAAYAPYEVPNNVAATYVRGDFASIAGAQVSVAQTPAYTGAAQEPAVSVTLGGKTLAAGEDYRVSGYSNNVNAGTATVEVEGLGDYYGTASGSFTIAGASLGNLVAKPVRTPVYTGAPLRPAFAVTLGGKRLVEGEDYVVTRWASNVIVGQGQAIITGIGNYSGEREVTFAIAKAANPAKVSGSQKAVSFAKLKKKAQTASPFSVAKAMGKVTFARVAKGSSKALAVNKKTGKVTVKKGTKRGAYKVNVKVKVAGDGNYKPLEKTVAAKVRVK